MRNGELRVQISIRDMGNKPVENVSFTGKNAVLDTVGYLSRKYLTSFDILKNWDKLW